MVRKVLTVEKSPWRAVITCTTDHAVGSIQLSLSLLRPKIPYVPSHSIRDKPAKNRNTGGAERLHKAPSSTEHLLSCRKRGTRCCSSNVRDPLWARVLELVPLDGAAVEWGLWNPLR